MPETSYVQFIIVSGRMQFTDLKQQKGKTWASESAKQEEIDNKRETE